MTVPVQQPTVDNILHLIIVIVHTAATKSVSSSCCDLGLLSFVIRVVSSSMLSVSSHGVLPADTMQQYMVVQGPLSDHIVS